jgi:guanylate kinase
MKKIIVLLGASATGKDTVAKHISEKYNIPMAISYTTRPMRSNETQGIEYYFISDDEMHKKFKNGEVIEHTSYYIQSEDVSYTYANVIEEFEKGDYVLTILNPHGLYQFNKSQYKDNLVSIMLNCDDRVRLVRSLNRDENVNVNEVLDRFRRDELDFIERRPKTDYEIDTNKPLEEVFNNIDRVIENILKGER